MKTRRRVWRLTGLRNAESPTNFVFLQRRRALEGGLCFPASRECKSQQGKGESWGPTQGRPLMFTPAASQRVIVL